MVTVSCTKQQLNHKKSKKKHKMMRYALLLTATTQYKRENMGVH